MAAIKVLSDSSGILHDICEPDCGVDGGQFKGIFMRNLIKLHQAAPSPTFDQFITANAASITYTDRNADNEFGLVWSKFQGTVTASTQSSALDALLAAAVLS
jgi:hypothetical protein